MKPVSSKGLREEQYFALDLSTFMYTCVVHVLWHVPDALQDASPLFAAQCDSHVSCPEFGTFVRQLRITFGL